MDPTVGLDVFTKLGANAILGWIVWYMLSRAVPNLVEKFVADSAAARAAYLAQNKDLHDQFVTELRDSRADFKAEIAATRDHCREELDRLLQRPKA